MCTISDNLVNAIMCRAEYVFHQTGCHYESNTNSLRSLISPQSSATRVIRDFSGLLSQLKLYEEDLQQERTEAASQKHKTNFQLEQWKKNCQRMGQQVKDKKLNALLTSQDY